MIRKKLWSDAGAHNDNHARERAGVARLPVCLVFEPSGDESDFRAMKNHLLKPFRVGARGDEHDDRRIRTGSLFAAFPDPVGDTPTVGRIAEHGLPPPVMVERAVLRRVVLRAFRIPVIRRRIQREMEFPVKLFEQCLGRFPIHPIG